MTGLNSAPAGAGIDVSPGRHNAPERIDPTSVETAKLGGIELELKEGGDEESGGKATDNKPDTVKRVTLADGTQIDKQMADFNNKDTSKKSAE